MTEQVRLYKVCGISMQNASRRKYAISWMWPAGMSVHICMLPLVFNAKNYRTPKSIYTRTTTKQKLSVGMLVLQLAGLIMHICRLHAIGSVNPIISSIGLSPAYVVTNRDATRLPQSSQPFSHGSALPIKGHNFVDGTKLVYLDMVINAL